MAFHIIGLPHTVSHELYSGCAFTGHVRRLSKGLTERGHTVYHYGNFGANLECTKHISVTDRDFVEKRIGDFTKKDTHTTMYADKHLSEKENMDFHVYCASEIRKRAEQDDYVILSYGAFVPQVLKVLEDLSSLPIFIIESSIGYLDSWQAPYKIFESESVRSWTRSQWNQNFRRYVEENPTSTTPPGFAVHECTPQFTDDTIHTFADTSQFEYKDKKENYFLYIGRLIRSKGIDIAIETCEKLGEKLVIAGHGNLQEAIGRDIPDCVDFVGHADVQTRKELMANAKGGFVCTYYSEHGGNVIHEFGLSGTPVIATNWGSFTHSVLHKITGYLIQDGAEAEYAAKNIHLIEPKNCRKWQMNYTIERTLPKFERYFERIKHIWYNGNNAFASYPVEDLDHRELIHPYDTAYDIDLKLVQKGQNSKQ